MPSQRGLKLLFSVLGFPAGAGVIAHTLSGHYRSLMNFDGTFFLVQAMEELYDSGIPQVPRDVQNAVEWILEREKTDGNKGKLRQKRSTVSVVRSRQISDNSTAQEEKKDEIFQDDSRDNKKYWCRYFDYSGGKDNVIMQYDPFCTLYNVFEIQDPSTKLEKASTDTGSSTQNQNRQVTIKLTDFQSKTEDLEKKRLKNNSEFKQGGFYILKLDKNKIPQANSTFSIEITKPGKDKWNSERTYQPKISTLRIQAQLTGDPTDSVKFTFSNPLPSSKLIVKKVSDVGTKADSPVASPSPPSDSQENEEASSYYFKHSNSNNNGDEKLHIEHAWSFGNKTSSGSSSVTPTSTTVGKSKFDLSTLDKAPLKDFDNKNGTKTPKTTSTEQKHYLFKSASDFWKYKVGDHIDLYKSTKPKNSEKQLQTQQDQKVETFEVVAGALVNLSRSFIRCVNLGVNGSSNHLKPILQEEGSLIDPSWDKNKDYCNRDGAPSVVLILLGYNGVV